MANAVIDLRKLKNALRGRVMPEHELPPATARRLVRRRFTEGGSFSEGGAEEPLPETEALPADKAGAARPRGFDDEAGGSPALLAWTAPESEADPSAAPLLLVLGGLLILGGAAAAFFRNFLFAIFLLISGALVLSYAFRPPRRVSCDVTGRGVRVGNRLYEFNDLRSFWIHYDPPLFRELVLRSQKTLMPLVRVPLGELDPLHLREVLLRFLREAREEPSAVDTIAKRIGF